MLNSVCLPSLICEGLSLIEFCMMMCYINLNSLSVIQDTNIPNNIVSAVLQRSLVL